MPLRPALLASLTAVIWGVNFVVIDKGIGSIPPLTFAAIRFVVVAVPAVFLVPRPKASLRDVALVALFMSVGQFGLLYSALHLGMPPGLASLVLQAQVMLSVILAVLGLGERPRRNQVYGIAIGTAGLAIVAVGRGAATPALALLLTLGAALSWACGNVAARRIRNTSGLSLTVWGALFVPIPLFALSLLVDGPHAVGHALSHFTLSATLSTAYTAYLASLVGYGIWNSLLARYPASEVTPFALVVPVTGFAAAWIVDGESPSVGEWIGGLVMLGGVALTTLSRLPRPRRTEHPAQREEAPGGEAPGGPARPARLGSAP